MTAKKMTTQSDILIIGAGGVGCAVARELSRYQLKVTVLEKECDVAAGTSGRNSAVVHAGFNNKPGSLMASLCVEGNEGFETLVRDLGIPYKKTGKILVAFDDEDMDILRRMAAQGEANGCKGIRLINADELHQHVPGVGGIGGMLSPETAIFDPFTYCVALAENALTNGVAFKFNSEVTSIERVCAASLAAETKAVTEIDPEAVADASEKASAPSYFLVTTSSGARYQAPILINCAGLFADHISEMAGVPGYHLYPCRGEYFILDKVAESLLPMPVYPAPKPGIGGLGVHLTPTIDGNIIIGPSAEYIDDNSDYACTAPVMDKLFSEAKMLLTALERKHIIGNYAGIRPKLAPPGEGGYHDFVIKEEETCPGLINLIGIESPGLTASVPIAKMVTDIVKDIAARHADCADKESALIEKPDFISTREAPIRFRDLSEDEQAKLIKQDPEYGEIICRCQKVTKREIRNAIENPFGARSISAIKYRAWATTGRCNGGYCLTRIVDMLIHEYGVNPDEITYRGSGSELFSGEVK